MEELVKLAKEHQVYLFEAARNYHEKAFAISRLSQRNKTMQVVMICQPSSKMPELLKGYTAALSDQFAGGAMDLGVYPSTANRPLGQA